MGFLDSILSGFGAIFNAIAEVLIAIIKFVILVAQFIWQALVFVANALITIAKAVGNFFVHLWENFFKNIFLKVFQVIGKVTTWLEQHLRPIINFLRRVQALWLRVYTTYIRPILNLLNHVRQVLSILRALHIKWAATLDNAISNIEGKIVKAFLAVNSVLNASINLLNILADPRMLLRRPTMLLSFRNIFHAMIRSITGLPPAFFFPSPSKNAPKGLGFLPLNFDPTDPNQNPPPSYYLGLDFGVPGLEGQDPDIPVPNEFADGVGALEYFTDDLSDDLDCLDANDCLAEAARRALAREFEDVS